MPPISSRERRLLSAAASHAVRQVLACLSRPAPATPTHPAALSSRPCAREPRQPGGTGSCFTPGREQRRPTGIRCRHGRQLQRGRVKRATVQVCARPKRDGHCGRGAHSDAAALAANQLQLRNVGRETARSHGRHSSSVQWKGRAKRPQRGGRERRCSGWGQRLAGAPALCSAPLQASPHARCSAAPAQSSSARAQCSTTDSKDLELGGQPRPLGRQAPGRPGAAAGAAGSLAAAGMRRGRAPRPRSASAQPLGRGASGREARGVRVLSARPPTRRP